MVGAGEALELGGERAAGEWAGGEDRQCVGVVLVQEGDLFATDGDIGVLLEEVGYVAGELGAVDGEGVAGGNGGGISGLEQKGAGAAHLGFQEPRGGVGGLALEGVGADELGEVGGLVGLGRAERAHFGKGDLAAEVGGLESGFGPGETAADDVDSFHALVRIRRCASGGCRQA